MIPVINRKTGKYERSLMILKI
jgi:hypothetical protein